MEHPLHDSNSWFEPFHTSHVPFLKNFYHIIDYLLVFSIYSEKIYLQKTHWYGKFGHSKIFAFSRKPQTKRADVYFSTSGRSSPLYNRYCLESWLSTENASFNHFKTIFWPLFWKCFSSQPSMLVQKQSIQQLLMFWFYFGHQVQQTA